MKVSQHTVRHLKTQCLTKPTKEREEQATPAFSRDQVTLSSHGRGPRTSTPSLLERMKPYIKGVHVVSPGSHQVPPILGGIGEENQSPLPPDLPAMPRRRWVVTPEIEASHQSLMESANNNELRLDDRELREFIAPIMAERYGHKEDQVAVELGPAESTELAESLQQSQKNLYFGLDLSKPLLEKGRELMNESGYEIADAYQVQGNTYQMPFNDDVADVICVSCHPPFVSASPTDKVKALAEVKRVLKPGGEFVLFPWDPERKDPSVVKYLESQFEQVARHTEQPGTNRAMVILKARE